MGWRILIYAHRKTDHNTGVLVRGTSSGFPLDGELFIDRGKFQETVSIVRSSKEDKGWHKIIYKVFDTPIPNTPFEKRMEMLDDHLKDNKVAQPVKHWKTQHTIETELNIVLQKGGEGLMLRKPQSEYEFKRSKTLLKVKRFFDDEATVMSHIEGKGKHKGRMERWELHGKENI